jgi:hypothetical protein
MTRIGIIVPESTALKPGDVVATTVPQIGTLANMAKPVQGSRLVKYLLLANEL